MIEKSEKATFEFSIDNDNESQNLQQESGMLLMTRITQNMVNETKMILVLNLKQRLSNQIFVIIQMHIFL